ncbi:hypothetical protein PDESU_05138 [Pontiella desulfatans]|uniref:DUF6250 domain-containing protein n=1 Tax=Pontiella desulfatans TaxID=2750659 RepID=A0A6C2U9Z7_PONDE|nr:DUF6250 domain-containing protein [Pontiella desulfatans]VGO16547.1 hypothetical protein PDESU_05138 [Pontiella desulfatans]
MGNRKPVRSGGVTGFSMFCIAWSRRFACLAGGLVAMGVCEASEPLVLGYGKEAFTVGNELYATEFADPENWVVQVADVDSPTKERVTFEAGMLDLYMPDRGCTAWLNKPFKGPITIVYNVRCPLETEKDDGILATDINNFWHCSDPRNFDAVLTTTQTHYHGGFLGYHEMRGYYACTGGGRNRTTRFRRYPRWKDGKDIPHIAVNANDGKKEFLIEPGTWHTIQLVYCDGLLQYIKDGLVVYEFKEGDAITVETRDKDNRRQKHEETYTLDKFPAYDEGYFGFRMVGSHHQYKNLKIYELVPE